MPRGIDGSRDIKDETIQSVDIKDGTITNDDISSSAAIDQTKISNAGGWISNLASGGLTTTNIDTDLGNIDMSIYEPSNPADGDNWMVKNIGSSGNKAFNLPWEVELEDSQFMQFVASGGEFFPTFGNYNSVEEKYVQIWGPDFNNTPVATITNLTLEDGKYHIFVDGFAATTDAISFDMEVNRGIGNGNAFYSNSFNLTVTTNAVAIEYIYSTKQMRILGYGGYNSGAISKIEKLEDATHVQTSYPINRGLKPVWELTPAATVSKTAVTEFEYDCLYVVEFYLNGTSGVRVTNTIWVGSDLGTNSIYGSDLQSGGTPSTFSRILFNGSTSSFVANGVGTYSPTIKKIQKFTGFMTVKHDFKRIVKQSTFPPSPYLGDECYRDDLDEWYKYNGDVWTQI